MANCALILSGCGYLDGSEIQESVLSIFSLQKYGFNVQCFAPDIEFDELHHITSKSTGAKRNTLIESARIARGQIKKLEQLNVDNFDLLFLPGGYGVAKNLSNIAAGGNIVIELLQDIIVKFWNATKPIGAVCIAPALVACALSKHSSIQVTIGDDSDNMISQLGGRHKLCNKTEISIDMENKIVTGPAYMFDSSLLEVAENIDNVVRAVSKLVS